MFIRRHLQFFEEVDPRNGRRAAIRAAYDSGIKALEIARFLRVHHKAVYAAIHHKRPAKTTLEMARKQIITARKAMSRAQSALRVAEGKERAALERLKLRA